MKRSLGRVLLALLLPVLLLGSLATAPTAAAATTVTVSFDSNYGGSFAPVTLASGAALSSVPTPSRPGLTFMGWFTAERTGAQVTAGTVVTGNLDLHARWAPNEYFQYDPRWASYPYVTTMQGSGCGVTAATIAVKAASPGNTGSVTPVTAAQWSQAHGFAMLEYPRTKDDFFFQWPATYGLSVSRLNTGDLRYASSAVRASVNAQAQQAVLDGNWVIAYMGPPATGVAGGTWTQHGHFIVWYDTVDGHAMVRDPNGTKASKTANTVSQLQAEAVRYFVLSVPQGQRLYAPNVITPGQPTVTGTPQPGATLSVAPGVWGPAPVTFTYQWNRFSGGTTTPIPGATGTSYVVTAADVGVSISVTVTGSHPGLPNVTQTSFPTMGVGVPDAATAGLFRSVSPARVLDTRYGNGASGPVPGGGTVSLQVAGRGGVPASNLAAVVLNVTVTDTQAPGFVTAYPSGGARPNASNLNFMAGDSIPNLVTVKVGADGRVWLTNSSAKPVSLVADVAGYYFAGTPTAGGAFVTMDPTRLLDTRFGNGATGPVGGGGTVPLQVTGRGGVPGSGVASVVLNVTVTDAQAAGFVTVYPSGLAKPNSSNLNYGPGQTIPNLVTVKVGADGKVLLNNASSGTVSLVADVAGYYRTGTPSQPGAFVSLDPTRVLDTRQGLGAGGPVAAFGGADLLVAGVGGVPAGAEASAVVMNTTVTETKVAGFITVHPSGPAVPNASNLNFTAGQTIPNLVIVKLGDGGRVSLHNSSAGTVHLIGDVAGYFKS